MDEDCKRCFNNSDKECLCVKCIHDRGSCDCDIWTSISSTIADKNKDIDIFINCDYYKEDWVKKLKYRKS